ncbi:hypothetical protein [Synechococcus sp. MIT S1220]|uniref:hypothetical protein n=1 Tax=Synechococcus sp. MIT S1220 TaxID=3082549 RepID=UPI0039AFC60A
MTAGPTKNSRAVVTCTIGDDYYNQWDNFFSKSWRQWCEQNNYDLIIFKDFIEPTEHFHTKRSPAWQKLLAMAHPDLLAYEQALWLDSDIFIRPHSPDPLKKRDQSKVSMVIDQGSPLSREPNWFRNEWNTVLNRAPDILEEFSHLQKKFDGYYDLWGFNSLTRRLFNTGVIAFTPESHQNHFRTIYKTWTDGGKGALHEMVPLNLHLAQHNLIDVLDYKFNVLFGVHYAVYLQIKQQIDNFTTFTSQERKNPEVFLEHILEESHFLHFAGCHDLMDMLFTTEHFKNKFFKDLTPEE